MILYSNKSAFSLIEVLVASVVFAMMAVALLSYVQAGADAWRYGHQRMNVRSYFRAVSDAIQRDLQQASCVNVPSTSQLNTPLSTLQYDLPIFSGTTYKETASFTITLNTDDRTLCRHIVSPSHSLSDIDTKRYEYVLARDVATFTVMRVSSWTINVCLGIESNMADNADTRVESQQATMTFVVPAGR